MHACIFLCVSAGEYACDGVRVYGIRRHGAPRGLMLGTPSTLFMAGRELESGPTSAMDRSESEGALVLVLGWAARLTGGDDEGPVGRGFTCTLTNRMEPRASPTHGVDARTEIRARTPHATHDFWILKENSKRVKCVFGGFAQCYASKKMPCLSYLFSLCLLAAASERVRTLPCRPSLPLWLFMFPRFPFFLHTCIRSPASDCTSLAFHRASVF